MLPVEVGIPIWKLSQIKQWFHTATWKMVFEIFNVYAPLRTLKPFDINAKARHKCWDLQVNRLANCLLLQQLFHPHLGRCILSFCGILLHEILQRHPSLDPIVVDASAHLVSPEYIPLGKTKKNTSWDTLQSTPAAQKNTAAPPQRGWRSTAIPKTRSDLESCRML